MSRKIALLATLLFHLCILLFLLWMKFTAIDPQEFVEDSAIEVMRGTINEATGEFIPEGTPLVTPPPPLPVETPNDPVEETLTAQETEESIEVTPPKKEEKKEKPKVTPKPDNKQKEQERIENERQLRLKAEADARRIAEEQKAAEIAKRMAGNFGTGKTNNSGNSAGSGQQGSPEGNSDRGATTGVGGTGGSYALGGRGLNGTLRLPSYNVQEEGRIVIEITVSPEGNVLQAKKKNSTITNNRLIEESIAAAKATRFSSIKLTDNQIGTITYVFKLN